MLLSRYICIFMIYSLLGWIYETLYCTIRTSCWENRGFLYGPICPIYGVGAVLITIISGLLPQMAIPEYVTVFVIAFLGSMVLEYVTSWLLEMLFHAVWWDYSNLPLNLHGRTSIFTSVGFGLAGVFVVDWLAPHVEAFVNSMSMVHVEAGGLLVTAIFSADMTLTVSALTNMARIVEQMDESFNRRMEMFVESTQKKSLAIKNQIAVESMGNIRRLALKRVSGFRYPNVSTENIKNVLHVRQHDEKKE